MRPLEERDAGLVSELRLALPGGACLSMERMAIELAEGGEMLGFVEYADESPGEGWATFGVMAMREGKRGWGYGSEAVRLLEEHLGGERKRFRAAVSKELGLALYFWLRQGYQPAEPEQQAAWQGGGTADMIWMVGGENPGRRTENLEPRTQSQGKQGEEQDEGRISAYR